MDYPKNQIAIKEILVYKTGRFIREVIRDRSIDLHNKVQKSLHLRTSWIPFMLTNEDVMIDRLKKQIREKV